MTRVRFATVPTGNLFFNSGRVALANDLFCRKTTGQMLLRLDDLDKDRARPTAQPATAQPATAQPIADQIMQDLRWIGIEWHACYRQSERQDQYQATIERLQRDKFLYPCFESEEELKAKQEFRRKRNQSPIYDRAMLALTPKQRQDAEAGGKRPHWRFKLSGRTLEWQDLIAGPRHATLSAVSDPILVRADGTPGPILASVVDDIDYGTTHIIRGDDNAGNTAVQIELFEVLRGTRAPVRFAHVPTLIDTPNAPANATPNATPNATQGGRRAGNLTLRTLRNDGIEPNAIVACMTGIFPAQGEFLTPRDQANRFDLAKLGTTRFDMARMLRINRQVLAGLDFATVADRLPPGATEKFWLAIRGSLDLLKEARGWWDVVAGNIVPPVIEGARDLLLTAGSMLPPEPWDNAVWSNWITQLEQATQRPRESLIQPLRLALTGEETGPDLADLLPMIGRPRAATRLTIAAAQSPGSNGPRPFAGRGQRPRLNTPTAEYKAAKAEQPAPDAEDNAYTETAPPHTEAR